MTFLFMIPLYTRQYNHFFLSACKQYYLKTESIQKSLSKITLTIPSFKTEIIVVRKNMIISIAERHKQILEILQQETSAEVSAIANKLNITKNTIRKDLKILEKKGFLHRTHGNVSLISQHITNRNIKEKERTKEKQLIGIFAAELIEENDTIILNSGSTICAFAGKVNSTGNLSVVTPSIKVTSILSKNENINICQLGGTFNRQSIAVTGNHLIYFLKKIACSKVFFGSRWY